MTKEFPWLALLLVPTSLLAETTFYYCQEKGERVMRSEPCRSTERETGSATVDALPRLPTKRYQPTTVTGLAAWLALSNPSDAPDDSQTPPECRFKYYKYNDKRGAALAKLAKDECVENLRLSAEGKSSQRSLVAYEQWRDHFAITSQNRNAAKNQVKPYDVPPNYRCRSNRVSPNEFDCTPR